MLLDCSARGLESRLLVNRYGRIARVFRTGEVYCGDRAVSFEGENYIQGCGPVDSSRCRACFTLTKQIKQ